MHEKPSGLTCDTGSELLLAQALTRRGLAMDLMQLATYAVVEEYNSMLLNHLQSHAVPGYNKVTLQQVLKADQQAWVRLAETSGVKRAADGSLPMDAAIQALANDPKFTFYLLPLPLASQKRSLEDAAERPAKIVTSMEKAAPFDSSFDDTLEPDCEAVFGVPWSVDEFLERAASLVHPKNLHTGVPIELKDAIDWASWRSSCDMRNFRIGVIKEWLLLARDLNSAEKEIRLSLEPHVRTVLGQKRLKLLHPQSSGRSSGLQS